ncbi:hypothetical protein EA58_11230 [Photobacterium galatheae]|uniref:Integrin n=2 Tax=Photobacterium galatheae TaxID=1654360 RepID=A0A066RW36_9GAMM|nr:hypothetical protein EA58_11230 [Photobacterium galatheae]
MLTIAPVIAKEITSTEHVLTAKLIASDASEYREFGSAVAIDGNTLVIGQSSGQSVYVFIHDGVSWVEQAKLTPSENTSAYSGFGHAVEIDGDTIAVGAPFEDLGDDTNVGAVYLYSRSEHHWTEQHRILPDNPHSFENFGFSLALRQGNLLTGSPGKDTHDFTNGQVSYYQQTGNRWVLKQQLFPKDLGTADNFGFSIDISGDTAVIGSIGSNTNLGDAEIFTLSGGLWVEQQSLDNQNGAQGDSFGYSVAIHGDTIAIGAPYASESETPDQGEVSIYKRTGNNWYLQEKVFSDVPVFSQSFGFHTTLQENKLLIGTYHYASGAALFIFERDEHAWQQVSKLSSPESQEAFGMAAAIEGNIIAIGAPNADVLVNGQGTATGAGAVYLFESIRSADVATNNPTHSLGNNAANEAAKNHDSLGKTSQISSTPVL